MFYPDKRNTSIGRGVITAVDTDARAFATAMTRMIATLLLAILSILVLLPAALSANGA